MTERTHRVPLLCYSKPGRHFAVLFLILRLLSCASWLAKAIPFSLLVWGVVHSPVLRSAVLKDEKYVIIMQSHRFSCNLGIIALEYMIMYTNHVRISYFKNLFLLISDLCTINSCFFEAHCISFCLCLQTVDFNLTSQTLSLPQRWSLPVLVADMPLTLPQKEKGLACETNPSFR